MSCKFYPHPCLCGHKVCEDDYEITQEELDEIEKSNEEERRWELIRQIQQEDEDNGDKEE